MPASLLRPLTSGLQDERLRYEAQPSLRGYTKAFVKAGRFTTQWVRLDFNQVPNFGNTATVDLIRKGHFITRVLLVATLPDLATAQAAAQAAAGAAATFPKFCYTNGIGHALIQNVQMTISGTIVDQFDSQLLEATDEFHTPLEKVPAVNRLIGRNDSNFSTTTGLASAPTVHVPLPFWFCRGDSGAALPIDALGSDLVQLKFQFRPLAGCYYTDSRITTTTYSQGSALWPLAGSPIYKADPAGTVITKVPEGTNVCDPNGGTATLDPTDPTLKVSETGVSMPGALNLGPTYLLVEYAYVDRPEANRFRLADLQIPVIQHYRLEPTDTQSAQQVNIQVRVPNPARALYIYPQRYEAPAYNAHFLATRDLKGAGVDQAPWWPNSVGLGTAAAPARFIPAFALRDSEPFTGMSLVYEGNFARWATNMPSLFRSGIVGTLFPKTPWVNRYIYALPFGQNLVASVPAGEANLDKLQRTEVRLQISQKRGCLDGTVNRFWIYAYVENFNVLRVYGGRGAMLFSY